MRLVFFLDDATHGLLERAHKFSPRRFLLGSRVKLPYRFTVNSEDMSEHTIRASNRRGPYAECSFCLTKCKDRPVFQCTGRLRHAFCSSCAASYIQAELEPGHSFFLRVKGRGGGGDNAVPASASTTTTGTISQVGEIPCPFFCFAKPHQGCDCAALPLPNLYRLLGQFPKVSQKYNQAIKLVVQQAESASKKVPPQDEEQLQAMVQEREDAILDLLEENEALKKALETKETKATGTKDPNTKWHKTGTPHVEGVDEDEDGVKYDVESTTVQTAPDKPPAPASSVSVEQEIKLLQDEIMAIRRAMEEAQDRNVDLEEDVENWRKRTEHMEEQVNRLSDEKERHERNAVAVATRLRFAEDKNERLIHRLDLLREKLEAAESA